MKLGQQIYVVRRMYKHYIVVEIGTVVNMDSETVIYSVSGVVRDTPIEMACTTMTIAEEKKRKMENDRRITPL